MPTTIKPVDFVKKIVESDPKDIYLGKDLGFIEKPGFFERLIRFFFPQEYQENKLGIVSSINTFVETNKGQLLTLSGKEFDAFHSCLNLLLAKKLSPKASQQRTQLENVLSNLVEERKPKEVQKQTFDRLWTYLKNADSSHLIESKLKEHLAVSSAEADTISMEVFPLMINGNYNKETFQQLLKRVLNIVIV